MKGSFCVCNAHSIRFGCVMLLLFFRIATNMLKLLGTIYSVAGLNEIEPIIIGSFVEKLLLTIFINCYIE